LPLTISLANNVAACYTGDVATAGIKTPGMIEHEDSGLHLAGRDRRETRGEALRDSLPEEFSTLEDLWSFWDTHSSADYEDLVEPVEVEIDLFSSKAYCPVEKDLLREVRSRARQQGVSTEALINLCLQEKLCTA
jgi:CopG antitoxin of type II toxin-antitoxin system